MPNYFRIACVIALAVLPMGCGEDETIHSYHAPKDPPPVVTGNSLEWTAPPSWKELPAGQMRVAAYAVTDTNPPVELTVIPLPPQAGELVPNVNRWEGQLGLPPSNEEKIKQLVKKEAINGIDVSMIDLSNDKQRMLAAMAPFGGRVWYFKMMGAKDAVTSQQDIFNTFIHSLHAGNGAGAGAGNAAAVGTAPQTPVPEQREGPDSSTAQNPHASTHTASQLTSYKAPDGWKELANPTPPRVIAFTINDDPAQKTEMIATRFAGNNAGNFLDNINRWRMQLGLAPVSDAKDVTMHDAAIGKGAQAVMIELENPGDDKSPAKKMLVAIASSGGDLYFFKLTGPSSIVEGQRAAFDQFLKSLELNETAP